MSATPCTANFLQLNARLETLESLRYTPGGVAVVYATLIHQSLQTEAGHPRDVRLTLQTVALGELAAVVSQLPLGVEVAAKGFLAAKSVRSTMPVFHLTDIELIEGI